MAYSSGWPRRASKGVSKSPGAMVQTRISRCARSRAQRPATTCAMRQGTQGAQRLRGVEHCGHLRRVTDVGMDISGLALELGGKAKS